jgi:hypothetical protein
MCLCVLACLHVCVGGVGGKCGCVLVCVCSCVCVSITSVLFQYRHAYDIACKRTHVWYKHTFTNTHAHTRTRTHTHTHTHTHTWYPQSQGAGCGRGLGGEHGYHPHRYVRAAVRACLVCAWVCVRLNRCKMCHVSFRSARIELLCVCALFARGFVCG